MDKKMTDELFDLIQQVLAEVHPSVYTINVEKIFGTDSSDSEGSSYNFTEMSGLSRFATGSSTILGNSEDDFEVPHKRKYGEYSNIVGHSDDYTILTYGRSKD